MQVMCLCPSNTSLTLVNEQEGFAMTYSSGLAAVYAVCMDLGMGSEAHIDIYPGSRLLSTEKNFHQKRIPWLSIHHRCVQER